MAPARSPTGGSENSRDLNLPLEPRSSSPCGGFMQSDLPNLAEVGSERRCLALATAGGDCGVRLDRMIPASAPAVIGAHGHSPMPPLILPSMIHDLVTFGMSLANFNSAPHLTVFFASYVCPHHLFASPAGVCAGTAGRMEAAGQPHTPLRHSRPLLITHHAHSI